MSAVYGVPCAGLPATSLLRLDLGNAPALRSLLEARPGVFRPQHWPDAAHLLLADTSGSTWWVDPQSGAPSGAPAAP